METPNCLASPSNSLAFGHINNPRFLNRLAGCGSWDGYDLFETQCSAEIVRRCVPTPQGPIESRAHLFACAATCLLSATLLLRAFFRLHERLLLWNGICFVGLMLENVMLYIDVVVVPDVDFSLWRKLPGLVGLIVLLFGLIWDSK